MSAYPKYKRMGSRYGRSEEEAFLLHPADPLEDSGMCHQLWIAKYEFVCFPVASMIRMTS